MKTTILRGRERLRFCKVAIKSIGVRLIIVHPGIVLEDLMGETYIDLFIL